MNELQTELLSEIQKFVDYGFYNREEILEIINDLFYEETLDEDWLEAEIEKAYNKRLEEQRSWPETTVVDKLNAVFEDLVDQAIVALHNAGYTQSEGETDAYEAHMQLKAEGIDTIGYCFYHGQDVEGTMGESRGLYLAFGDFKGDKQNMIAVGEQIVAALLKHGFSVQWDGTAGNRIQIQPFQWQNRVPEE